MICVRYVCSTFLLRERACQNIFFNTILSDVRGLPGNTSAWANPLLGFELIIPPIFESLLFANFYGSSWFKGSKVQFLLSGINTHLRLNFALAFELPKPKVI